MRKPVKGPKRPTKQSVDYFQDAVLIWFSKNKRDFPWRSTKSIYIQIISEIFLRRTKAAAIGQFIPSFSAIYPSWKSIAQSSPNLLERVLLPIGLAPTRSRTLFDWAKEIIARRGRFPRARVELEALPGVGQYIASAILLFAH